MFNKTKNKTTTFSQLKIHLQKKKLQNTIYSKKTPQISNLPKKIYKL